MGVGSHRHAECPCRPEVRQLDGSLGIDEQVLGLEVAVQHPVGMAEGQALQQLEQVTLQWGQTGLGSEGTSARRSGQGRRGRQGRG